MNYKDFELAPKKRKTEEAHKAIKRKQMVRSPRPRAKENYFAKNNPNYKEYKHFGKKVVDFCAKVCYIINICYKDLASLRI